MAAVITSYSIRRVDGDYRGEVYQVQVLGKIDGKPVETSLQIVDTQVERMTHGALNKYIRKAARRQLRKQCQ